MRNPWQSSLSGHRPALVLLLLGATAAACASPDAGDGPLGNARAAIGAADGGIPAASTSSSGIVDGGSFSSSGVIVGAASSSSGVFDGGSFSSSGVIVGAASSSSGVGVSSSSSGIIVGAGSSGGFGGGFSGSSVAASGGFVAASSAAASGGFGGFGGGSTGGPAQPVGFWQFNDCTASSAVLLDSSGFNNTANRTETVACVPGIQGLAVDFKKAKDVVTVSDGISFEFANQVAVAAWINPTTVAGTQAIVDQEFNGKSTFALSLKAGFVQFTVTLSTGKKVTSSAPITAGVWSHVAGSYDGHFVFLYLDGQQVGQVDFPGNLQDFNGPIRIGNNESSQHFDGAIDNVWISTDPVTDSDIAALACIHEPLSFVATPAEGPPSGPDTAVNYSVVVTNNDAGFCASSFIDFFPEPPEGFTLSSQSNFATVAPGASATFPFTVTSGETLDPGVFSIPFFIDDFNDGQFVQGQVEYDLTAPTGCFVFIDRELMITDLSVVEDPIRTTWTGPASDPRTGAWTFATLMQNIAPTPDQAPAMVQQLVNTWLTNQQVGGFTVAARPAIQQLVIDPWPKTASGALDLTKAPLRLDAIVNRLDVRKLDQGTAGEGRFVFAVLDQFGNPLQFTLIVEYNLPATSEADVLTWANRWHALSLNPFPSESYNAALQALTTQFTGAGTTPGQPNGSSLAQLRTNEIALSFEWELREFHLSPTTGFLVEANDALTPDLSLNGQGIVADFVNQNQALILQQLHTVPPTFEGQPFQAGSSLNPLTFWSAPGIANNDARQLFSLNTCNGCHGQETGTAFLHIAPRFAGEESQLSGFLTGITVSDPVSGVPRVFGDLAARKADLTSLVCTPAPVTPAAKAARSALIRTGRRSSH